LDDRILIEITKKELYDSYNSYGYQYVQNYGYSLEEAYKTTLNALIEREILIKISVERFGAGDGAGVYGYLTAYEADSARKKAFDALNSGLQTYIDEFNGVSGTSDDAAAEESDAAAYKPYDKTIYYDKDKDEFTKDLSSYKEVEDIGIVPERWTPEIPAGTDASTFTRALARVIRNLESRESGFEDLISSKNHNNKKHKDEPWGWFINSENSIVKENLDSDEQEKLNRELLRIIKSNEKTAVASRVETLFTLGLDGVAGFNIYMNRGNDFDAFEKAVKQAAVASNSANSAITAYKYLVKQAMVEYNNNAPEDMEADLLSMEDGKGLPGVYYIPKNIADNLFTVSHILVSFTDEQKTRYEEITALADTDSSFNKENALLKLKAETRFGGETVYEIYNNIKSSVDSAETLQAKYNVFRDLIYKYNAENNELINPDFEYVMSVNTDKNGMIPEFTAASIDLKTAGIKGAVSGIVWGQYGAHIIMYTRDLGDFIYTGTDYELNTTYANTLFAPQTAYGNKTIFDTLLSTASYTNYEKALIAQYKMDKKIEINKSVYKNLYGGK
jgi:hypothetical protein